MPTYQPGIPTGFVDLDQDYLNIQNNFQALDDSFGVNHIKYSVTSSKNGKHTFVELLNTLGNVIPTPLANFEGTLYTKSDGTQSQLWYTNDNSGNEYQLTAASNTNFSNFAANSNGWTYLPGGLIFNYGNAVLNPRGTLTTISFPRSYSSNVYSVTFGLSDSSGNAPNTNNVYIKEGTLSNSGFSISNSSASVLVNVYWMAIGS